jgi:hypothetical protein
MSGVSIECRRSRQPSQRRKVRALAVDVSAAPHPTQIGVRGFSAAVCAQVSTRMNDVDMVWGFVLATLGRTGVAPMSVRAVTADLVLVGGARGGVLTVALRCCVAVGGDLEQH